MTGQEMTTAGMIQMMAAMILLTNGLIEIIKLMVGKIANKNGVKCSAVLHPDMEALEDKTDAVKTVVDRIYSMHDVRVDGQLAWFINPQIIRNQEIIIKKLNHMGGIRE